MVLNPKTTRKDAIKSTVAMLAGLVILGGFIILLGGVDFWAEYDQYNIRFTSIKDLTPGRPVKFAGLGVGRVLSLKLDPEAKGKVRVVVGVEKGFPLYEGTRAQISQKGLVGDNYVLLELEGEPGPRMSPGAYIPQHHAMSMNEVVESVGEMLDSLKPKLENVAEGLEKLFDKKHSQRLQAILEKTPRMMDESLSILHNLESDWLKLTATARSSVQNATDNIELLSYEMADTLDKLELAVASLEAELSQTSGDIGAAVTGVGGETNQVLSRVGNLTQTVHKSFEYDQEKLEILLDNMNKLTREVSALARSLRERPWQLLYQPEERPQK
jgi:phospholipid/cholesterol/gamma-HCH transport system substrate-binding protein